jgi:hypothetical protein
VREVNSEERGVRSEERGARSKELDGLIGGGIWRDGTLLKETDGTYGCHDLLK